MSSSERRLIALWLLEHILYKHKLRYFNLIINGPDWA